MSVSSSGNLHELFCDHNHLFENPFCKKISLIKRIFIIIFHILTLCIPLALYHIISFFILKPDHQIDVVLSEEAYVKGACAFADKLLADNPETQEWMWRGEVNKGSDNNHLERMIELYWMDSFVKFKKALYTHLDNTWENEEVLESASDLLRVSFAIAEMTFKDIASKKEGYAQNMRIKKHYAAHASYYCSSVYTWIKAGAIVKVLDGTPIYYFSDNQKFIDGIKDLNSDDDILFSDLGVLEPEEFYQPGTMQNKFRLLYNEYCNKFEDCINRDPLYVSQKKKIYVPIRDEGPGSFKVRCNPLYNYIYRFLRLHYLY